ADMVIILIDGNTRFSDEDFEVINRNRGKKVVLAVNKSDLPHKITTAEIHDILPGVEPLWISAKYGDGISELKEKIYSLASDNEEHMVSDVILSNLRHKNALEKTAEFLAAAKDNISRESSLELAAFDIRAALDHLGDIAGETTNEDVLDRIFSTFCVGK
ncbi:MAG: tRNA uridine-5-carboxymethylaminomethyl(34) synthesis GTPase MnmE, partial [Deltaproteobacteria bacterium]|nr:tRNA uridine-5-carboxymethylaminomethyl(34) synthesis GTPase MnmE [Deltaproteobacteria bacterium]